MWITIAKLKPRYVVPNSTDACPQTGQTSDDPYNRRHLTCYEHNSPSSEVKSGGYRFSTMQKKQIVQFINE